MGPQDEYIETVLTCEGDYYDPEFHSHLETFSRRLRDLITQDQKQLILKKVEPWNSVRVTFNIPKEAAVRLKQLAQKSDQTLRHLGILAVQIEGDNIISLTMAGKNDEPTQFVFKPEKSTVSAASAAASASAAAGSSFDVSSSDEMNQAGSSSVDVTRKNIVQYLRTGMPDVSLFDPILGPTTGTRDSREFKTPNIPMPQSDPAAFKRNNTPGVNFPFGFSPQKSPPSQGIGVVNPLTLGSHSPPGYTSPSTSNQPALHTNFPSPGSSAGPLSPKYPTPPPSVSNPNSPGIRTPTTFPVPFGHNPPLNNMNVRMFSNKDITSSSPLLVNLLQSDPSGAHFNNLTQHHKMAGPPVTAPDLGQPPGKVRKRKARRFKGGKDRPERPASNEAAASLAALSHAAVMSSVGVAVSQPSSQLDGAPRVPPLSDSSPLGPGSCGDMGPKSPMSHTGSLQQMVNPYTGQLEPVETAAETAHLSHTNKQKDSCKSMMEVPALGDLHPPPNPLVALRDSLASQAANEQRNDQVHSNSVNTVSEQRDNVPRGTPPVSDSETVNNNRTTLLSQHFTTTTSAESLSCPLRAGLLGGPSVGLPQHAIASSAAMSVHHPASLQLASLAAPMMAVTLPVIPALNPAAISSLAQPLSASGSESAVLSNIAAVDSAVTVSRSDNVCTPALQHQQQQQQQHIPSCISQDTMNTASRVVDSANTSSAAGLPTSSLNTALLPAANPSPASVVSSVPGPAGSTASLTTSNPILVSVAQQNIQSLAVASLGLNPGGSLALLGQMVRTQFPAALLAVPPVSLAQAGMPIMPTVPGTLNGNTPVTTSTMTATAVASPAAAAAVAASVSSSVVTASWDTLQPAFLTRDSAVLSSHSALSTTIAATATTTTTVGAAQPASTVTPTTESSDVNSGELPSKTNTDSVVGDLPSVVQVSRESSVTADTKSEGSDSSLCRSAEPSSQALDSTQSACNVNQTVCDVDSSAAAAGQGSASAAEEGGQTDFQVVNSDSTRDSVTSAMSAESKNAEKNPEQETATMATVVQPPTSVSPVLHNPVTATDRSSEDSIHQSSPERQTGKLNESGGQVQPLVDQLDQNGTLSSDSGTSPVQTSGDTLSKTDHDRTKLSIASSAINHDSELSSHSTEDHSANASANTNTNANDNAVSADDQSSQASDAAGSGDTKLPEPTVHGIITVGYAMPQTSPGIDLFKTDLANKWLDSNSKQLLSPQESLELGKNNNKNLVLSDELLLPQQTGQEKNAPVQPHSDIAAPSLKAKTELNVQTLTKPEQAGVVSEEVESRGEPAACEPVNGDMPTLSVPAPTLQQYKAGSVSPTEDILKQQGPALDSSKPGTEVTLKDDLPVTEKDNKNESAIQAKSSEGGATPSTTDPEQEKPDAEKSTEASLKDSSYSAAESESPSPTQLQTVTEHTTQEDTPMEQELAQGSQEESITGEASSPENPPSTREVGVLPVAESESDLTVQAGTRDCTPSDMNPEDMETTTPMLEEAGSTSQETTELTVNKPEVSTASVSRETSPTEEESLPRSMENPSTSMLASREETESESKTGTASVPPVSEEAEQASSTKGASQTSGRAVSKTPERTSASSPASEETRGQLPQEPASEAKPDADSAPCDNTTPEVSTADSNEDKSSVQNQETSPDPSPVGPKSDAEVAAGEAISVGEVPSDVLAWTASEEVSAETGPGQAMSSLPQEDKTPGNVSDLSSPTQSATDTTGEATPEKPAADSPKKEVRTGEAPPTDDTSVADTDQRPTLESQATADEGAVFEEPPKETAALMSDTAVASDETQLMTCSEGSVAVDKTASNDESIRPQNETCSKDHPSESIPLTSNATGVGSPTHAMPTSTVSEAEIPSGPSTGFAPCVTSSSVHYVQATMSTQATTSSPPLAASGGVVTTTSICAPQSSPLVAAVNALPQQTLLGATASSLQLGIVPVHPMLLHTGLKVFSGGPQLALSMAQFGTVVPSVMAPIPQTCSTTPSAPVSVATVPSVITPPGDKTEPGVTMSSTLTAENRQTLETNATVPSSTCTHSQTTTSVGSTASQFLSSSQQVPSSPPCANTRAEGTLSSPSEPIKTTSASSTIVIQDITPVSDSDSLLPGLQKPVQTDSKIVLKANTATSSSSSNSGSAQVSSVVNCDSTDSVSTHIANSRPPVQDDHGVEQVAVSETKLCSEEEQQQQQQQPVGVAESSSRETISSNTPSNAQPESGEAAQKSTGVSKRISILKPLYDREADLDDDSIEGFQKVETSDVNRHSDQAPSKLEEHLNKKKTSRDASMGQSAFTVANILSDAKRTNQVFIPQKSALPLIVNKEVRQIEQQTLPVVTLSQKPVSNALSDTAHMGKAHQLLTNAEGFPHNSSQSLSNFLTRSLHTPTKMNFSTHPIAAPGFPLDLTESVKKVMQPIPFSDTSPPISPKSSRASPIASFPNSRLCKSTPPTLGKTTPPLGKNTSPLGKTTPPLGRNTSPLGRTPPPLGKLTPPPVSGTGNKAKMPDTLGEIKSVVVDVPVSSSGKRKPEKTDRPLGLMSQGTPAKLAKDNLPSSVPSSISHTGGGDFGASTVIHIKTSQASSLTDTATRLGPQPTEGVLVNEHSYSAKLPPPPPPPSQLLSNSPSQQLPTTSEPICSGYPTEPPPSDKVCLENCHVEEQGETATSVTPQLPPTPPPVQQFMPQTSKTPCTGTAVNEVIVREGTIKVVKSEHKTDLTEFTPPALEGPGLWDHADTLRVKKESSPSTIDRMRTRHGSAEVQEEKPARVSRRRSRGSTESSRRGSTESTRSESSRHQDETPKPSSKASKPTTNDTSDSATTEVHEGRSLRARSADRSESPLPFSGRSMRSSNRKRAAPTSQEETPVKEEPGENTKAGGKTGKTSKRKLPLNEAEDTGPDKKAKVDTAGVPTKDPKTESSDDDIALSELKARDTKVGTKPMAAPTNKQVSNKHSQPNNVSAKDRVSPVSRKGRIQQTKSEDAKAITVSNKGGKAVVDGSKAKNKQSTPTDAGGQGKGKTSKSEGQEDKAEPSYKRATRSSRAKEHCELPPTATKRRRSSKDHR